MAARAIKMSADDRAKARQAVLGENGQALIDIITDGFLLRDSETLEEAQAKSGVGEVVKFMRALREDSNIIEQ